MIYDGIFLVTSAICVNGRLSIYNNQQRYEQTLETIKSIKDRCPNSKVFIIDVSTEPGFEPFLEGLTRAGAKVLYIGNHPSINKFSKAGFRSEAETIALLTFLDWFDQNKEEAKRIYKVSGRYRLSDNFKSGLEHTDSYVFPYSEASWMSEQEQKVSGVDRYYEGRLYHMDYSLLDDYKTCLSEVLDICLNKRINIEHALYSVMRNRKVIEVEKVGITGNVAPSGEFKDQ